MNLDEYITKFERGAFSFQELEKITDDRSINTIFRLYGSYGEANKTGFYDGDSLSWILSSLEEALKLAGFDRAASLLKIDINESFSQFWVRFEKLNRGSIVEKNNKVEEIRLADPKLNRSLTHL